MIAFTAPKAVVVRLQAAINEHDLAALLACVSPDYPEVPPTPAWGFGRPDTTRRNWEALFRQVPDLRADALRWIVHDDSVWTQWHWHGTQATGTRFDVDGATLFGVADGLITWGQFSLGQILCANGHGARTQADLAAARRALGDPGWARVRRHRE